jgi:leucyl-tRNA synthetase
LARSSPEGTISFERDLSLQDGTIQTARFPTPSTSNDKSVSAAQGYIKSLTDGIHQAEGVQLKKKAKGKQSSFDPKKPKRLWVYVATEFPAWQQKYIDALQECYNEVLALPPKEYLKLI